MKKNLELKEKFQSLVASDDIIIHDIVWKTTPNGRTLEVSIRFADKKMDVDTCQSASEKFSDYLDAEDIFDFEYILDVCSPGAERELRNSNEIAAEVGEYVYIKLMNPKDGMHEVKGSLESFEDGVLSILYMDKTKEKTFEVEEANINLIRLAVRV